MKEIEIIDRKSQKKLVEKIYGQKALDFLYGESFIGYLLMQLISRVPFFSRLYGWIQKTRFSQKKVKPFIDKYQIDEAEFQKKDFDSFNDFFIRKLKKEARSICEDPNKVILFADARYRFFPDISKMDGFLVKGKNFSLSKLLQNDKLAKKYEKGSMVIARLCPTDCHRFHFSFDCIPSKPKRINGYLYSVNPKALLKNVEIFTENKREITQLQSKLFGQVQYIEIGATYVGSIHQTYHSDIYAKKGEEKGYFSFGGSCIILLFEEGKITFDPDLIRDDRLEIRGLLGQSMGSSK